MMGQSFPHLKHIFIGQARCLLGLSELLSQVLIG